METLNKIKDRAEVMSVLLSKSTSYWSYIDKILKYPLIISSSGLVIINSYFQDQDDDIKLYNVIFNGINVIFMAIINNLSLTSKIENLKSKSQEFYELSHEIEAVIMNDSIDNDKIIHLQQKYDMIMRYTLVEAIPDSIRNKVRDKYDGKKTVPLILNGFLNASPLAAVRTEEV